MIRHQLFSKGEYIHVLLMNARHSNVMFPVRAIIHDVKFDDKMPKYQIRIVKFYDDIKFLKRYLFGMQFDKDFDGRVTKFHLKRQQYSSVEVLQNHIDSKWESYLVSVDSVMCVKTKAELTELFNNLQDFLIEKSFKEIFELSNRAVYSKGKYYYHTRGIFEAHLKKFLGEREPNDPKYYDKLLYRPEQEDLDKIERN